MKKTFTSLSAALLLMGASQAQTIVTTTPQYKNAVLEEYTGIYCGYCPDGHLIASTLKSNNPGRVVLVNIHEGGYATPSGNDPDFRTSWGAALASDAGVSAYPTGTVNRHLFSGSALAMSRGAWVSSSETIMNEVSPVNIGATSSYNSGTGELTIDVEAYYTSNSATATNYLNVVLIQDSLLGPQSGGTSYNPTNYVGSDYVHSHMLRDMVTGQWGDPISTTTQGSLYTNQYVYTPPTDINGLPVDISNCHLAIYISESQQEIYTGISIEADGGSDDGDHAPFIGDFAGLNNAAVEGSNANVSQFTFSIDPLIPGTNDYDFELTSNEPGDWGATYSVDGTTYSAPTTLSLTSGTAANITIDVTPGTTPSVSDYTLTMTLNTNSAAVQTQNVYVISGVTDLIVNGSGSNGSGTGNGAVDYEAEFTDGLAYASNSAYDATSATVLTLLSDNSALGGVNNLYVNIGWTFPSFQDEEVAALEDFMDNGGNLFVAGQDIAWDIASGDGYGTAATQSFFSNYMHAGYQGDGSTANSSLDAVATDNVFGNVSSSTIVDAYSGNMYPDELTLQGGAVEIFNYNGGSKIGGLRADNGTFKVVYIGVALEMIDDNTVKDEIVKLAHDWFYGLVSDDEMNINHLFNVYPNPTRDILNINTDYASGNYKVTNLLGEVVLSGNLEMVNGTLPVNVSELAEGTYNFTIENGNNITTKQFVKVK